MSFEEIPYVKLVGEQRKSALEILGKGNRLLKKWSAFFPPKKCRNFRNAVMSGDKNPNACIPSSRLAEFVSEVPLIMAIRKRYEFLDNRSTEEAILQGYSAMAKQHAKRWSLEGDPIGLSFSDFLQEAYMQVIEAMYSWDASLNVNISTYIWWALKNRMSNVTNQQGNTFRLTNEDLKLLSRYRQVKRKMLTIDKVTFEEIAASLELTHDENVTLRKLLTQVYSETGMLKGSEDDPGSDDTCNDYTGYRANISGVKESDLIIQQQHVESTLNRANLTTIEREVMVAAMNPYHGWQTEFALNHINPKSNLPYSRMRITQILQEAQRKLKEVIR